MGNQRIFELIAQSSVAIDGNSLFMLIKEQILSTIWEKLAETSKSIGIASESFERLLLITGTPHQNDNTDIDEKFNSELQLVNKFVKQYKILRHISAKFKDVEKWYKDLEITNSEIRLMESIALVSLFGIDDYILLVTDNPYLMEFLLQMQKRSFIKSRITFISSYHFVLAFFTRCHITTEHLLKFQGNYFQNLLHSKDSIIQQWAKNLVKKAMEETPRAVKEKPEIYGPDAEKQEIIRLITSFSLININDYQTIGNYRRFDENSRNAIFSLFECIVENLKSEIVERKNFIIWAPPGSGKTFLIKEIAKRLLTSNNVFYEINMAKISGKKELSGKLNKISRKYSKKQIIVLFDEIDAHYDSTWPFEVILGFLDNLTVKPIPLIFFAGSAENSLEEFIRRKIANRPKGKDVLSRIFIHNRFNLPVSVDGDRLIMAISEIINFNKTNGYNISYIEKAALYYLLSKEGLKNPRQLTEYIKRSLGNVNKLDLRLKYDQLFNYGSKEIKSFWTETKEIEGLYDHFIQIHS